ncbi:S-adenosyl-L-methionine-dependent methyltransferase [Cladochytrium replicatum]|nr:S-adenosyl-L-methionine-dependent methyltransferase [Cladochytrium replicatum]
MSQTIPVELVAFLSDQGLDVERLEKVLISPWLPRFFRLRPKHLGDAETILQSFKEDLASPESSQVTEDTDEETFDISRQDLQSAPISITNIRWLQNFYRLEPGNLRISGTRAYKDGKIMGMDVSSGAAIQVLDPGPNDHLLDLCCAPGAKLCFIADLQQSRGIGHGSVTGVDISTKRMEVCRSTVKKAGVPSARLFVADGTKFNVPAPARVGAFVHPDYNGETETISRRSEHRPFFATRMVRHKNTNGPLYDRVIVDAECTHDGSVKHLRKWAQNSSKGAVGSGLTDQSRLEGLEELQRGLISNGFRMLRPGGVLVYSTCSVSKKQNEEILEWFLSSHSDAQPSPIPKLETYPPAARTVWDHVLKFPVGDSECEGGTGGMYIARIVKMDSGKRKAEAENNSESLEAEIEKRARIQEKDEIDGRATLA